MTDEIIGRLNGITGEPGTIIGYSKPHEKFVSIAKSFEDPPHVLLRFTYGSELVFPAKREPRSLAEHHAIPPKSSPYGIIRQFHQARK